MYEVDYRIEEVGATFLILRNKKVILQVSMPKGYENLADIELAALEYAKAEGYWPAVLAHAKIIGKRGGKKTAITAKKGFHREAGKKGAKKRWNCG